MTTLRQRAGYTLTGGLLAIAACLGLWRGLWKGVI